MFDVEILNSWFLLGKKGKSITVLMGLSISGSLEEEKES